MRISHNSTYWQGRIAQQLHLDADTMKLRRYLTSVYFLLLNDANGDYGIVLDDIAPPDECLLLDAEGDERAAEFAAYQRDLCGADRITNAAELNRWLAGFHDPEAGAHG